MWKVEKIVKKGDYLYALVRDHPHSTKNGYVLEHRIVMENHLNRLLTSDEVVHHKNENKKDNRIENLVVMGSREHLKEHMRGRGSRYCRLKCPQCSVTFDRKRRNTHLVKGGAATFCSRSCSGRFYRTLGTHEVECAISGNLVMEYVMCPNDNPEET